MASRVTPLRVAISPIRKRSDTVTILHSRRLSESRDEGGTQIRPDLQRISSNGVRRTMLPRRDTTGRLAFPFTSESARMSRVSFVFALCALVPSALASQAPAPKDSEFPPLKVVDVRWIDTTASACVDFSQYANGAWLAHDTIPAAYSSSGVTRDMSDRNELVVRSVLEDAAAKRNSFPPDSTPRKLGTFYATCMDSTAIEAAGANPIRPWLLGIDSITTRTRLLPQVAKLQVLGVNVAFRYSPDVDPHDAAHYLTWLSQGGLGLPDRDYYLAEGAAADSTRRAFVTHVASLLRLVGQDSVAADGAAAQVMALETSLAQASM